MKQNNLPLDEVLRRLSRNEPDKSLLMQGSMAFARRAGTELEDLILAHYIAVENGISPRQEQNYGEVRLIRESLPLGKLRERLSQAAASGSFTIAEGVSVEHEPMASMELLPSDEPAANIGPRCRIELSVKRKGELSGAGPLIQYGHSSFVSVEQAVRSWIPLRPFHGHSDGRLGRCLVEIRLPGPRLGAIELIHEHSLRVGFQQIALDTALELTGVWQSNDASAVLPFAHSIRGEPIDVIRPSWGDRVALWLVTADSQVRDYFNEDPYNCSRQRHVLYPRESEKEEGELPILAKIHGGEDELVEFKPFLRLDSSKFEELIRTAIAFANKRGGTIYLGVSDYQEIDGVEKELREAAPQEKRGSRPDYVAWYCAAVRKRISDCVSRAFEFECTPAEVCGKLLICITVIEGKAKPYCDLRTKEIWTRRGANTVRPDPAGDELKQLVSGSDPTVRIV